MAKRKTKTKITKPKIKHIITEYTDYSSIAIPYIIYMVFMLGVFLALSLFLYYMITDLLNFNKDIILIIISLHVFIAIIYSHKSFKNNLIEKNYIFEKVEHVIIK